MNHALKSVAMRDLARVESSNQRAANLVRTLIADGVVLIPNEVVCAFVRLSKDLSLPISGGEMEIGVGRYFYL